MNDSKLFNIILALLWAINAVIALVYICLGMQMSPICAFCPAAICTLLHIKKIFEE